MKPIRTLLALALFASALALAGDTVTFTVDKGAKTLESRQTGPGTWTCQVGGVPLTAVSQGSQVTLRKGDTKLATGAVKEGKLVLRREDGSTLFTLKVREDKVKFFPTGGTTPYEFKFKENKVKVVYQERVLGKVRYYPDSGKLKAKNPSDEVVASTRDLGRLSAALAPFLVPDLDDITRVSIMLTLLALGK